MPHPETPLRTAFSAPANGTLSLQPGVARRLRCAPGTCVHVVSGSMWLTLSGDPEDYFLQPGQLKQIGSGRAVIEADSDAVLTYALYRADAPIGVDARMSSGTTQRVDLRPRQLKTL